MDELSVYRAMGAAFWIFMSGVIVATAFWAVRKFAPPKAQWWLLSPMGAIIRRLAGREQRG